MNRFGSKARESVLGSLVDTHISDQSTLMDALSFIESPAGLEVKLYPVQRVLVKLIFGIPMDDREQEVPVYDIFCDKLLYTFKETDYIKYVYDQGRINIPDWRDAKPLGYNEIDVIVGRRGGKSCLVAAVTAYKLYRLLNHHSPQEYFGLVPGSPIDLTMVGTDAESSSRIFDQLKNYVNKAPFFTPFVKSTTTEEITFVSEKDRTLRDVIPSIKAMGVPCTTNKVRGPSSFVLVLDEFAFYRQHIGASSDEMYEAATPATMQFKAGGTREGRRESMVFIITSPGTKMGKYYTLHRQAMEEGASSQTLTFRCSTAEMNPRSDIEFLKSQYKGNPEKFMAEYGGNFLEASDSFVKSSIVHECVDKDRGNVDRLEWSNLGHKYFWGLDLGMKHDATALAICHWEGGRDELKLKFDLVDRLIVGQGKYVNHKEIPLDDLMEFLIRAHNWLPCYQGATDQYGGSLLVQLLHAKGILGMELIHLTGSVNSQMYLTLKNLLENRQISLPDVPELVTELLMLETTYTNKYQIRVAAPEEKEAHDDLADAVALAAHKAQTWALDEGRREIQDIMTGNFRLVVPGELPVVGLDGSMSALRMQDRAIRAQLSGGIGAVKNPWRRR